MKRDKEEIEQLQEHLENENFFVASWRKNDVRYNAETDSFVVIPNYDNNE